MTEEPKRLKEGKGFHKKLQGDWIENAEGTIKTEKHIKNQMAELEELIFTLKATIN